MALITISGQPGSRHEEVARSVAQLLRFELVTESRLRGIFEQEFGGEVAIPDKAFAPAAISVVARLATEHHLVLAAEGAELLFRDFPGLLRTYIVAPESRRLGTLMLEHRLDRKAARSLLRTLDAERKNERKRRFGRSSAPAYSFDLVLNTELLEPEGVAELIQSAAARRGFGEVGLLSAAAEAHLQFQVRLKLSKYGIQPPGRVSLKSKGFVHPSEEVFANLLDFYRVAWEYEPRSFPIQWDKDGRVLEAFTPDFYLPEFDLYVELTTMKQSLVTKKNRKVKLLRAVYPHVNIQVFYQKDFENLIFKYGLAEREPGPGAPAKTERQPETERRPETMTR
jgi:cytidylate kinase